MSQFTNREMELIKDGVFLLYSKKVNKSVRMKHKHKGTPFEKIEKDLALQFEYEEVKTLLFKVNNLID